LKVRNAGITIPPNTARHEETAYISFPENATLFTVFPHAHYRGENMAISLLEPGAKEEKLILSLPKYDFNWQRGYDFATPISIKPGTKLITLSVRQLETTQPADPSSPSPGASNRTRRCITPRSASAGMTRRSPTTDDYQKRGFNMGIMDTNMDDKVAKSEVRGRMGTRILAAWDQLDTNKDGYLVGRNWRPSPR
jgi:hypothetical protein